MPKKLLLMIFIIAGLRVSAGAETVLTVDRVRQLALEYNRQLQSAKRELDRSSGEIISARAGALPQISINGTYTRNMVKREMFLPGAFFDTTGFVKIPAAQNNDFGLALSLTQPIYNGGKVGAALSIAKIYSKYSREKVAQVESEIVYGAESMFYRAVLAESGLEVLKSAHDQLAYNYEVVEKYYNQGMVSEFELLRARVEKLNLEPQIVAAESQVNLSRKQLKSFLGLALDEEVRLVVDYSDTTTTNLPELDTLINLALQNRPEIKQAALQKRGYDKAVRIAQGDWLYPSLNLNTTYDLSASSDDFRITENNLSKSWTASVLLTIPIFDGGRTIGEVRKAKTDYYQAVLSEQQARDDIRLEVEGAYDTLIQAKKALELQKETIQQAEEGMRIANLRYQTGIGTQLEILSAQTALTDARTNLAGAIYQTRLAKSALKKATSFEVK
nr:TolC family protein [candidate division Zixibacteria bacterium]